MINYIRDLYVWIAINDVAELCSKRTLIALWTGICDYKKVISKEFTGLGMRLGGKERVGTN